MIKAVIFDVDGVIFDSEEIHYEVEAKALSEVGIPATLEIIKEYSGARLDKEFLAISKRFNKKISLPGAIKIRDRILREAIKKGFPLTPYVESVLKSLSKDYLLAISTSGERRFVGKQLKSTGLLSYFKVAIFGEDIKNPKPNPDAFLLPAKKLSRPLILCHILDRQFFNGLRILSLELFHLEGVLTKLYMIRPEKYSNFNLRYDTLDMLLLTYGMVCNCTTRGSSKCIKECSY